jgi:hypothetical protein
VQAGIPALTVELGGPRGFDAEMMRIGVEGAENLLAHYKIIDTPVGQTAKDRNVFRGNDLEDIGSITGRLCRASGEAKRRGEEGPKRSPSSAMRSAMSFASTRPVSTVASQSSEPTRLGSGV